MVKDKDNLASTVSVEWFQLGGLSCICWWSLCSPELLSVWKSCFRNLIAEIGGQMGRLLKVKVFDSDRHRW